MSNYVVDRSKIKITNKQTPEYIKSLKGTTIGGNAKVEIVTEDGYELKKIKPLETNSDVKVTGPYKADGDR